MKKQSRDHTKVLATVFVLLLIVGAIFFRLLIAGDHPHCFWAEDIGSCIAISEISKE